MGTGFRRLLRELGSWPREIIVTLIVTVVVTVVAPPFLAVTFHDKIPVWAAVLAVGFGICAGIVRGASGEQRSNDGNVEIDLAELQSRVATLGTYDTYAVHVRDALADLRRTIANELPNFSLREFIETGIFEPANVLLQRDHQGALRGDVRFSILYPSKDGADFLMANDDGLFPAHGHRAESREKFRLPINGSFAGVAFHSGKVQASNHLSTDDRYNRHPRAETGREYESMVSVPLWKAGKIDGVVERHRDPSRCVLGGRSDIHHAVGFGDRCGPDDLRTPSTTCVKLESATAMREPPVTPTSQDAFRSLVEGRITTEQYLRSLDERVEELRDEPSPTAPPRPEPQAA